MRATRYFLFYFLHNFIYLFLSLLGLYCRAGFSLVAMSRSYTLAAGEQASHCVGFSCLEHRLWGIAGFGSCGSQALDHRFSSRGTQA